MNFEFLKVEIIRTVLGFFGKALSHLYKAVQSLDSLRFDLNWSPTHRVNVPVISVGNLTVGGTGKTVFVDYLLTLLRSQKILGVACRGYRAGPDGWNDEMTLLKNHHPDLHIAAHPKRAQAADELISQGCQLIVLDDGFQHRSLHRDLNIVLLDATDPFSCDFLPRGRRREAINSLFRADLLVLSHFDKLSKNSRESLRRNLQSRFGKPVISGRHNIQAPKNEAGEILPPGPIHLIAGVARPHHVSAGLEALGYSIKDSTFPGDHRSIRPKTLKKLENSPWPLVCTEKDWVKLSKPRPGYVATVKWEPMEYSETLHQRLQILLNL